MSGLFQALIKDKELNFPIILKQPDNLNDWIYISLLSIIFINTFWALNDAFFTNLVFWMAMQDVVIELVMLI